MGAKMKKERVNNIWSEEENRTSKKINIVKY